MDQGKCVRKCYYCGPTKEELRPYGPNGANICFPCMKATPEREEEAKNRFNQALGRASKLAPMVLIGTEVGPVPFNPAKGGES